MPKIVAIDNEYITLECFPEEGLIAHVIQQPLSGQPFRDALNTGTDMLVKHGCYKWLSDDRKNGPLDPRDVDWAAENWNRRTIDAGWKYWGLVVPTDVSSTGSLTRSIIDLNKLGLRVMVSNSLEEARRWLEGF